MEQLRLSKRSREEDTLVDCEEFSKKQKPFNHILSLLEADELDEPTQQDLSPLITTLQQEITSSASNSSKTLILRSDQENDPESSSINNTTTLEEYTTSISFSTLHSSNGPSLKEDEVEDDKQRVMRHLLEASDDELGIPSTSNSSDNGWMGLEEDNGFINGGDGFSSSCDGLWELEDETANYYTLLQSELFL